MSDFARQQDDFQRGILAGDDKVLAEILDSPQEKRAVLFGVYRHAYGSRLVEAMRADHEALHAFLGDEMFDEMGHAYVAANPSQHPNLRWFSQGLPDFLKSHAPYSDHPVLTDLAALEKALNDAGAKREHVIRTRVFLKSMNNWEDAGRAHGEFFHNIRPASTMIQIVQAIDPGWLVEIEADAIVT